MFAFPTDECGIVAQVSAPLAQAEISTYYISTFYTDHTLVSCAYMYSIMYKNEIIDLTLVVRNAPVVVARATAYHPPYFFFCHYFLAVHPFTLNIYVNCTCS